ncbi:MAG: hypothetical protein COU35_02630 [Candidatus Magasanikbacteria bacterium CG10_big_fil_rev_8_21_14_0_10_47_10]|uniref:Thioredoxin-like fold domain-containing protein n=1 Tax=Candidatus Magasanikbacteria bacterium CG10_big_fil_rev_8_21_14_0_10_47_10 TaxID=1974652 RepID=A0A2H0TQK1_9BACT|nr:MAG: hypothetical protein COU35_02630 [Candidatus Magasanikbacteria bacterium CG10_big_fil_rev_8_21_14_0_10_47_10]
MIKIRHLIFVFTPAILVVGLALFIRISQYEPLEPDFEQLAQNAKNDQFSIPIFPEDPVIGSKTSPITLVNFADFGCEACKEQHEIITALMAAHPGQIKTIWKGLPVTRFPFDTRAAHTVAFCMNQVGAFDAFAARAFANSDNLSPSVLDAMIESMDVPSKQFNECRDSGRADAYIQKIETVARALDIQSVPAIFIDNKQIQPPATVEAWESLLQL